MSDLRNHPNIEMLKPGDLKLAPTHARKHSAKQVEQIARVIDRIGFLTSASQSRRLAAFIRE